MTGFGRAEAERSGVRAVWELRSVNGKGLDLRFRLPGSVEEAERAMRSALKGALQRGNVQAALTIERQDAEPVLEIDHERLATVVGSAREASERHALAMPDVSAFLAMRGVMRAPERDDTVAIDAAEAAIEGAVSALLRDREREGASLRTTMEAQIDRIEVLTERAAADPSRRREVIRKRLAEQVERLTDTALDPDRLHAEAAYLAVRADLAEELDRLRSHVAAARALLEDGGAVGRRLDFLAQEFAREANTLCAKSNAAAVTAIGLDLKVVIDQLREQIQNVE